MKNMLDCACWAGGHEDFKSNRTRRRFPLTKEPRVNLSSDVSMHRCRVPEIQRMERIYGYTNSSGPSVIALQIIRRSNCVFVEVVMSRRDVYDNPQRPSGRFVVVDTDQWVCAPTEPKPKFVVILHDFGFWAAQADELKKWCKQHKVKVEGTTLSIPDDHVMSLFVLRWS